MVTHRILGDGQPGGISLYFSPSTIEHDTSNSRSVSGSINAVDPVPADAREQALCHGRDALPKNIQDALDVIRSDVPTELPPFDQLCQGPATGGLAQQIWR